MSNLNKRKHLMKEYIENDYEHPTDEQLFAKIISSPGNNLHLALPGTDEPEFLVSLPTKFRKVMWIGRKTYVIVQRIAEGKKVRGEIVRILTNLEIKQFIKDGIWPEKFMEDMKNLKIHVELSVSTAATTTATTTLSTSTSLSTSTTSTTSLTKQDEMLKNRNVTTTQFDISSDEDSDNDGILVKNPNRPTYRSTNINNMEEDSSEEDTTDDEFYDDDINLSSEEDTTEDESIEPSK